MIYDTFLNFTLTFGSYLYKKENIKYLVIEENVAISKTVV